MKNLAIDIGGTYLRSNLSGEGVNLNETLRSDEIGLLGYIDSALDRYPTIGNIAVSYAGQVEEGRIVSAPNIHIDCYEIARTVESRYGVLLTIDNDLNCALRAEAHYRNSPNIAVLSVGTGIGAAVMDRGNLIAGSHNMAFELGHIPYKNSPILCGCGRCNCVELYASGSGLGKWLIHYGIDPSADLERLRTSSSATERTIAAEFEEAVLHASGVLVTLANPEILVLGGGVIRKNPYLLDSIRHNLKKYALAPSCETLRIEPSVLENPSLEGAKLMVQKDG